MLAVAAAGPKGGAAVQLVFEELPSNLKTSTLIETPPTNENPPELAEAGADDPVLAGVVSVFPHWKVEEVPSWAAAVCLREPAHPVDPIFPARTAVLAGVVSVFPHWKIEEVPSRAAAALCLSEAAHLVDPMVTAQKRRLLDPESATMSLAGPSDRRQEGRQLRWRWLPKCLLHSALYGLLPQGLRPVGAPSAARQGILGHEVGLARVQCDNPSSRQRFWFGNKR